MRFGIGSVLELRLGLGFRLYLRRFSNVPVSEICTWLFHLYSPLVAQNKNRRKKLNYLSKTKFCYCSNEMWGRGVSDSVEKLELISWLVNVVVASHVPVVMYGQAVNGLSSQNFASQAVARADLGGGACPQDAKHCVIWHWNNTILVCTAIKNATNGIKLGLSFSPGL